MGNRAGICRRRDAWSWVANGGVAFGFVVLVASAVGLLWTTSIPFHRGPDEAAHFQVARFVLDAGRLPVFRPDELWLIQTPAGAVETYATFPPLAYLIAALAMALASDDGFWAARVVSLASYVGTVAATYVIAAWLRPARRMVPLCASAVVAFLPQFAFTGAYFNTDALAVFETSVALLLLLALRQRGARLGLLLGLGIVLGSMIVTKYPFYPAAGVMLISGLALQWRLGGGWRGAGTLLVGLLLTAGWWLARNYQLYGEIIPSRVITAAKSAAGGNTLTVPAREQLSPWDVTVATSFWESTLQSFVGVFGLLNIFIDPHLYQACAAAVAVAAVGVVLELRRLGPRGEHVLVAVAVGALAVVTLLGALAISTYGEYSPQGRYLFAIVVPLGVLIAVGWDALARQHLTLRWIPGVGLMGAATLNLICLFSYVVPHEFGAPGQAVLLHIDLPGRTVAGEAPLEIRGWSFQRGGGEWRPFAPEILLSYRRPVRSIMVWLDGPPGTGRFLGQAVAGLPRPDVQAMYGGVDSLISVGFRLVVPDAALPPGAHRLYVCANPPEVKRPTCDSRAFDVI